MCDVGMNTKRVGRVAGGNQAAALLVRLPERKETACKHRSADAHLTELSSEEILFLDLGGFVMRELEKAKLINLGLSPRCH